MCLITTSYITKISSDHGNRTISHRNSICYYPNSPFPGLIIQLKLSLQILATDSDLDENAELYYSWDEMAGASAVFKKYLKLDENTGDVSLKIIPGKNHMLKHTL